MNIDRFVELNKSWLDKFEHNDYKKDSTPGWWNGNPYSWCDENNSYFIPDENEGSCAFYHRLANTELYSEDLVHYFNNWKQPTKEEMDYYELVNGYRLPWSEENPFVWED